MGREIESRQGIGFAAVKNETRFRLLKTGACAIMDRGHHLIANV
jgi:hypothetical protein